MFMPILLLPLPLLILLDVLLHMVGYVFLRVRWGKIFQRLGLTKASQALVGLLPVWIVFGVDRAAEPA
jgi:hypothetical protein